MRLRIDVLKARFPFLSDEHVRCGVWVPIGWLTIIERLCDVLHAVGVQPGEIHQVKEKLGGLRVYHSVKSRAVSSAVFLAEIASLHTCQLCGNDSSGPAVHRHLIETLCQGCRRHKYGEPEE